MAEALTDHEQALATYLDTSTDIEENIQAIAAKVVSTLHQMLV